MGMYVSYDKIKKWRRVNKERAVECFGGKCGICGYNKCISSLEFHHLDDTSKDFAIAKKIVSWKRTVAEVQKCVMLCSNCHREVHYGVTDIPDDIMRFEEKYTQTYLKDKKDSCPVCGDEKYYKLKTCSRNCMGVLSQKVDWDNINLEKLLQDYNYSEIGRKLKISSNAVKKRAKKLNLVR